MSFASDIASFNALQSKEVERVVKGAKMALFGGIIRDTPVDTGRLAGNWQCSIGSPASGETSSLGRESAVAGLAGKLGTAEDDSYLTNNLPYAERIEFEGWSREKSPEGMVRINLVRIANNLRSRGRA